MLNIPTFHQYNGETKIALMDNSAVAFMEQMERNGISAKELLRGYDAVFIPKWVIEEVSDSSYRSEYINRLIDDGFPIYSIAEESYSELANGEEGNLYRIVYAAVSTLGALKSYMRRYVQKEDPIDMSAYSDWISEMYHNWPLSDTNTENGRTKKKNAGEISLTILAEVFSWYYPDTELITVYTQDRDTFDYQMSAHRQLKEVFRERTSVDVSYKSNDFLLYQMYRNGTITREKINDVRKDERVVTYTKRRPDQAVALASKKLNNRQFIDLLEDESVQIIF